MLMFDDVQNEIKLHTGDDVHVVHLARQPLIAEPFHELRAYTSGGSFYSRLYKNSDHVSDWQKSKLPQESKS